MHRSFALGALAVLFVGFLGCASEDGNTAPPPGTLLPRPAGTGGSMPAAPVSGTTPPNPLIVGAAGAPNPPSSSQAGIKEVHGSGTRGERVLDVAGFDALSADVLAEIDVSFGPQRVRVSGDDNVIPLVMATVDNGQLTIKMMLDVAITFNQPLKIEISVPTLSSARIDGLAKLTLHDVKAPRLTLDVTSAEATATGQVEQLTVSTSLSGKVDTSALTAKSVALMAGVGSEIRLTSSQSIDGDVSPDAVVHVLGQPAVRNVQVANGGMISYE